MERAKEKRKKKKEKKIGRHPAGPGRAGVLRIEPDGAVSTHEGRSSLTWGAVSMADFGQKQPVANGRV
ncbi:hypothetical protein U8L64_09745 [Pseudomonas sp. FIP_A4]|uniref:hypothetical protein n=1 Tax=Pseudomonas sp. FIP_A4 TaxID=3070684 RepID=UPI002FCFC973